ncbi:MAG: hypothetical protein KME28_06065 [Pelatocladus maniniholoensis HA4357-MV3]|uniref:Uncharacterized protein n=1 Tax=Pelatocladus maniniholoensis HA4357-MV3 TaxID=1117104 RepID=A0A9E3H5I6_9NOST|nr:hypothetical protein [Pelatocladus maniniholoensis HA4357-MV3]
MIGLRQGVSCSDTVLQQVKQWLLKGLIQGIGSRVNSGYGKLKLERQAFVSLPSELRPKKRTPILQVPFELEGQLIHGYQRVDWRQDGQSNWQPRPQAVSEVRPIAFRSMLRYWFRIFALGVLPQKRVRKLEIFVFGGIEPQAQTGLFQLEIDNGDNSQSHSQAGILILHYSPFINDKIKPLIRDLLRSLTWLMFHLGGVGHGARRPYYKRIGNPQHRGVNLMPTREEITETVRQNWILPPTPQKFQNLFQQHLDKFYSTLRVLAKQEIDYRQPREDVIASTAHTWVEAVDINCEILVIRKAVKEQNSRPYALKILHDQFHDLESHDYTIAKSLCGGINKESTEEGDEIDRDVIPSPVWIANLHKYQVVTVFGANQDPRQEYLRRLKDAIDNSQNSFDSYAQIWPLHLRRACD